MRVRRPPESVPATDWTIDTSSASAGSSGGSIPGRQEAINDLPEPGGPTINLLLTGDPVIR